MTNYEFERLLNRTYDNINRFYNMKQYTSDPTFKQLIKEEVKKAIFESNKSNMEGGI